MSSITTLERNAPCHCGSNKKYKKCCANSFIVSYSPLTKSETKETYPDLSSEDFTMLTNLHSHIESHPEELSSLECDYIRQIQILQDKNPENPTIANYLVDAYAKLNEEDKMYEVIRENYEKFPLYLPAMTAEFLASLNKHNTERAKAILGSYSQIKELYPHRTTFHVSEVSLFAHAKVQYACKIDDLEESVAHLNTLKILHKEGLDPLYVDAQNAVTLLKARLHS